MSRKMFVAMATSLGVVGAAMPTWAHHSFSSVFDANKPVEVHGVLAEMRLENPHSWFYVNVTEPDGRVVRWGFEGSTPTSLLRSGFSPKSLIPRLRMLFAWSSSGTQVSRKSAPGRNPRNTVTRLSLYVASSRS